MTGERVIVVTGASSGIGKATALRFAKEGWRVALASRHQGDLDRVAKDVEKAGGTPLAHATDVTDEDAVGGLARAVKAKWGRVDVLVNGAGVGRSGFVRDMDVDDFDEQVSTNLRGPVLVTKAFLPVMLDTPGVRSIINVASVSGLEGQARMSGYNASKFGLRGFTQALAQEVSDDGIRVHAVNPGFVATPMVAGASLDPADMIQPEDLADLFHYLVTMPESMQIEEVTVWPRRLFSS